MVDTALKETIRNSEEHRVTPATLIVSHSRDHFADSCPLAGRISRDYHPLLGIAAGISDVPMARLREGARTRPEAPHISCCARRSAGSETERYPEPFGRDRDELLGRR
jgi:hypothetical protein